MLYFHSIYSVSFIHSCISSPTSHCLHYYSLLTSVKIHQCSSLTGLQPCVIYFRTFCQYQRIQCGHHVHRRDCHVYMRFILGTMAWTPYSYQRQWRTHYMSPRSFSVYINSNQRSLCIFYISEHISEHILCWRGNSEYFELYFSIARPSSAEYFEESSLCREANEERLFTHHCKMCAQHFPCHQDGY